MYCRLICYYYLFYCYHNLVDIQLFQERISEKVHAAISKGIVGDFEFTVFRKNFKEWLEKPWTYVCECLRKAKKVDSTATVSGKVHWSYPILPFVIIACTVLPTTFLEIAVYHELRETLRYKNKVRRLKTQLGPGQTSIFSWEEPWISSWYLPSSLVRESGKFLLKQSRILGFGISNTAQGIRNPTNDWNPESYWQTLE